MVDVMPKYIAIPTRKHRNFSTTVYKQSSMFIKILMGGRVLAEDNLWIGEIELPLSASEAGVARIEVAFEYDVR